MPLPSPPVSKAIELLKAKARPAASWNAVAKDLTAEMRARVDAANVKSDPLARLLVAEAKRYMRHGAQIATAIGRALHRNDMTRAQAHLAKWVQAIGHAARLLDVWDREQKRGRRQAARVSAKKAAAELKP